MTGALTIARYEITRRWPLWFVAFGVGLLPMAFLPAYEPHSEALSLVMAETLLVIGVVLSWTVAFTSGMSLVGRPLHDGRMSFYFTRPVSESQIAGGKILGGVVWMLGMQTAFVLPILCCWELTDGSELKFAGAVLFTGVAFLAAGLVVGILARSRTKWFLVDLAGGMLASTVTIFMLSTVNRRKMALADGDEDFVVVAGTFERIDMMLRILLLTAVLCILGAVVVAVARGRTDRERVHRMLSLTLWPALVVTSSVGFAIARWGFQ